MTEAVQEQIVDTQETEAAPESQYSFRDHVISLLSGLVLGGMVGGLFFALAFGAEYGAKQLGVEALTTDIAKIVFYNAKIFLPLAAGLIAAVILRNLVLRLPSEE